MPSYKNRFSPSANDKTVCRAPSVQSGFQIQAKINGSPLDEVLKNSNRPVAVGAPERNWDDCLPIELQDGSYTP